MTRIKAILAGFILAAGVIFATGVPANANLTDCPAGQGCLFTDYNGQGTIWKLPFSVYGTSCHNTTEAGSTWPHIISSVELGYGSGYGMYLYSDHFNCSVPGGDWVYWEPQLTWSNLPGGPICPCFNDHIYSFRISNHPPNGPVKAGPVKVRADSVTG